MARSAPDLVPVGVAVVAGVLSWDLVRLIGSEPEILVDAKYWYVGYPLMLATAFMLGLAFPEHPWRWGALIIGAQGAWAAFLEFVKGAAPNLVRLLAICALLALPLLLAAYAGQWARSRLSD